MKDILELIGRIFLASMFLFEAYNGIIYFDQTKQVMLEYGISWQRDIWAYAIIFLLIFASTLLILGYRVRLGVFLLLLYWIPAMFVTYNFWDTDAAMALRRDNMIGFLRAQAIVGGLLMIWAYGAGSYSIKRLFSTVKIPKN